MAYYDQNPIQPPAGATYISDPKQLAGLSEAQIWRQPGTNKIFKLAGTLTPLPMQAGEGNALTNKYVQGGYTPDEAAKRVAELTANRPPVPSGTTPPTSLTFAPTGEQVPTAPLSEQTGVGQTGQQYPQQGTMQGFQSAMNTMLSHYKNLGPLQDQKRLLLQQLYDQPLTPEQLRTLSPAQQEAIRNGDKKGIEYQIMTINDVLKGRGDEFTTAMQYMSEGYKTDQAALEKKRQTAYDNFSTMVNKYPDVAAVMSPEGFAAFQRGEMPPAEDVQKVYAAYKTSLAGEKLSQTAEKPVEIGVDMMGNKIFGVYDAATNSFKPVGVTGTQSSSGFMDLGIGPAGQTLSPEQQQVWQSAPQTMRDEAQALVDGRKLFSTVSKRTGYADKLFALAQMIDPTFSEQENAARNKYYQKFISGAPADNRVAINAAVQHMAEVYQLGQKLKNKKFGVFSKTYNSVGLLLKEQAQDPDVSAFNTAINKVSAELAKVYKGAASPTEEEIKAERDNIMATLTSDQLQAITQTTFDLLSGKVTAIRDDYKNVMGKDVPFNLIEDSARKKLQAIGFNPDQFDPPAGTTESGTTSLTLAQQKQFDTLKQEFPTMNDDEIRSALGFNKGGSVPANAQVTKTLTSIPTDVKWGTGTRKTNRGECGALVNDVTGLHMGDSLASKTAQTDPRLNPANVSVGDVFVQKVANDPQGHGHTGIINRIGQDSGGRYAIVTEANYHLNGMTTHDRKIYLNDPKITGFAKPKRITV